MKSIKSIGHTKDWEYIVLSKHNQVLDMFQAVVLGNTGVKNEYEVMPVEMMYLESEFIWAEEPLFF